VHVYAGPLWHRPSGRDRAQGAMPTQHQDPCCVQEGALKYVFWPPKPCAWCRAAQGMWCSPRVCVAQGQPTDPEAHEIRAQYRRASWTTPWLNACALCLAHPRPAQEEGSYHHTRRVHFAKWGWGWGVEAMEVMQGPTFSGASSARRPRHSATTLRHSSSPSALLSSSTSTCSWSPAPQADIRGGGCCKKVRQERRQELSRVRLTAERCRASSSDRAMPSILPFLIHTVDSLHGKPVYLSF